MLIGISTWLITALILELVSGVRLSTTAFFAGVSLMMLTGLLLLEWDRPPGIAIRLPILYFSLVLFSFSAGLFVYSFIVPNESSLFYLGLTLLISGNGGTLVGVKRTRRFTSMSSGYSMNRFRLWGILIGMGFALGISSILFIVEGNQPNIWIILIVLGFGLGVSSLLGLWLELKKPKR